MNKQAEVITEEAIQEEDLEAGKKHSTF